MQVVYNSRHKEIFEVSGRLITEKGFNYLTIGNIAKELNFSQQAIYHHFASEEEILVGLLKHFSVQLEHSLNILLLNRKSPLERFKTFFHIQFSFLNKNKPFVDLLLSEGIIDNRLVFNDLIIDILGINTKYLLPILIQGQRQKLIICSVSPEELLNFVLGSFRLRIIKWRWSGAQMDLHQYGGLFIQSLLKIVTRDVRNS